MEEATSNRPSPGAAERRPSQRRLSEDVLRFPEHITPAPVTWQYDESHIPRPGVPSKGPSARKARTSTLASEEAPIWAVGCARSRKRCRRRGQTSAPPAPPGPGGGGGGPFSRP